MNANDVLTANDEALEARRKELARMFESVPHRITLNGFEFTWQKRRWDNCLDVTESRGHSLGLSLQIGLSGEIKYYSFYSSSGNTDDDAEKTVNYYMTCAALLSEEFRRTVVLDFESKKETLVTLENEYDLVTREQTNRENNRREEKLVEEGKKQKNLEKVGQIWFDFGYYSSARYVVKSVTEKTVIFDIYDYNEKEGSWNQIGNTKRVSKHLLGVKPRRRERGIVTICPVGTDDLASQKPGQPETVAY